MTGPEPADAVPAGVRSIRPLWMRLLPPVLAGGLVYLNALDSPFVWDDFHTVVRNGSIEGTADLSSLLLQDASRPLVNLSFALDRALWGPAPFGFHLTSLLLHMCNVALVFVLAGHVAGDWTGGQPGPAADIRRGTVPAAAAWMFAVHPLMSEAVGYISGRTDVLSATCVLAALLLVRRWWTGAGRGWLAAAVALWVCALASKETAAVLPLLLLAYRVCLGGWMAPGARDRLARVATWMTVAMVLAGGLRLAVLVWVEHPGQVSVHWRLLLVNLDVARRYVMLLVSPREQTVFHPVVSIAGPFEWRAVGALLFTGGLLAMGWINRRRAPIVPLGILWFLLALLPSAVLVMLDLGHPMAEHRAYLANAGLFMAIGAGLAVLRSRPQPATLLTRNLLTALVWLGPVTLAGQTVVRNAVWSEPRVLWMEAVQAAPDIWLPHLLLGEALRADGMREAAVVEFREAVRLRPDYEDAYLKLGVCLSELGRLDEASAVFEAWGRAVPGSAIARIGLGSVAWLQGRPQEARTDYLEALRLDPANAAARQSLALLDAQGATAH